MKNSVKTRKALRTGAILKDETRSSWQRYAQLTVGSPSLLRLFKYECVLFANLVPGALGFLVRRHSLKHLFGSLGTGAAIGRGVVVRGGAAIRIGNYVSIDDGCVLDARGDGASIHIDDGVIISRNVIIRTRGGTIRIGADCNIGCHCMLTAIEQLVLGDKVGVGAYSYLMGGGNYMQENPTQPICDQEVQLRGGIVVQHGAMLGARVTVMDGVRIGMGSVIGAGAVVRENIPDCTVVTPHQRLVMLPRKND